jgi:hypothetical protein
VEEVRLGFNRKSGYSLGKAQRLLAGIDPASGPIFGHGAVLRYLPAYREAGIALPEVAHAEHLKESSSPPVIKRASRSDFPG